MSTLKFNRWQNLDGVTYKTVSQVVSASTDTYFATSSASFVDTPITLSITPTSGTSKVLVLFNINYIANRSTSNNLSAFRLRRNSTTIYAPSTTNATGNYGSIGASIGAATSVTTYGILPITYLDSPGTTNEITYTVQGCVYQNANSALLRINLAGGSGGSQTSTMTLMEILQ